MKLWRPVGMRELALVWEAGFRAFPPRLPEQPIFYPVVDREYAVQIARDWNTKEEPFAGYVTSFTIEDRYASRFEIRVVGGRQHRELWVPAEELAKFNSHLQGPIQVEAACFGPRFRGFIPSKFGLAGRDARQQLQALAATRGYAPMDFYLECRANELAVYLNFPYWLTSTSGDLGVSEDERAAVIDGVRRCWSVGEVRSPLIEDATRIA